jgi:hypothetical protein
MVNCCEWIVSCCFISKAIKSALLIDMYLVLPAADALTEELMPRNACGGACIGESFKPGWGLDIRSAADGQAGILPFDPAMDPSRNSRRSCSTWLIRISMAGSGELAILAQFALCELMNGSFQSSTIAYQRTRAHNNES